MSLVSKNLLTPSSYNVSRFTKRKTISDSDLTLYVETLREVTPEFENYEIDGFTIIGKTNGFQKYLATKDDEYYIINIARKKGVSVKTQTITKQELKKDLSKIVLTTKKLRDSKFDDSLFIPMKSNTAIDYCFSNEGGIMPGTNYILIGDPGIGKSSVSIEFVAKIASENPNLKVLFISAEMTEIDMIPYTKRFPLWLDLETLFVSDLVEGLYKESIEQKLSEGYDLVLIDSFAELADAIRGDFNESVSGKDKKTYLDIEKLLVDLMVSHNKAENDLEKNTSFIAIQQMTKGGEFVGSNKIKHNTTGMIELRYTKSGQRKIVVSKNRRGFEYDNLYFEFGTDCSTPIVYDVERIKRDKQIQEEVKRAASEQLNSELETSQWFDLLGTDSSELDVYSNNNVTIAENETLEI
jgi:KaiC/GvpD/RAD55 family RecA-like ATPase